MDTPSPIRYIVGSKNKYIETLQKRKGIIDNLCMALSEYLSMDIDAQLENMDTVQEAPEFTNNYRSGYTVEALISAQHEVESLETQLDDIEKAKIPDELKEYLKIGVVPTIKMQLDKAKDWLKHVQEGLEKDKDKDSTENTEKV
jgi:hypothetical protein